ncbi:RidA family protein [Deminuibacter soli]|uniref:RidA family protein n=2 Tax=Deminuibacter soli TaxID=2291815 RepID=A0A3E1NKC9_9BACT|nr:RidA family protein [Deminuibacter soli]
MTGTAGIAQQTPANVKLVNPAGLHTPNGYSHMAEIDLGNSTMLIISGQVALDKNGALVGKDDLEKQAEQALENIKTIVQSAGGNMSNVVKMSYFMTDISKIAQVRAARDKFVNTANPPASTSVQVSRLFREDILIEIEATAIIPKPKQ